VKFQGDSLSFLLSLLQTGKLFPFLTKGIPAFVGRPVGRLGDVLRVPKLFLKSRNALGRLEQGLVFGTVLRLKGNSNKTRHVSLKLSSR
jgi:hypothetical protein